MSRTEHVKPSKPECICFDLSGTLVAWKAASKASFREAVGEWLGRWGDEDSSDTLLDEVWLHFQNARKSGKTAESSIREAITRLPTDGDERTVKKIMLDARQRRARHADFMPGAEEALQRLSPQYRLAIITNLGAEEAKEIWTRLRLHRFIKEKDVYAAGGGVRKPDPRFFRKVADALNSPPSKCVMIGNSYKQDILGALDSGWQAVWVHKKARPPRRRRMGKRYLFMIPSIRLLPQLHRLFEP